MIQVAIMPTKPAMAIHQMCQIMAKPNTTLKAAMMTPAPEFFGMWMGAYLAGWR
ncbi:hypothetical protein D1872_337650 [compost metagenome]